MTTKKEHIARLKKELLDLDRDTLEDKEIQRLKDAIEKKKPNKFNDFVNKFHKILE